jgi:hypothetical protein
MVRLLQLTLFLCALPATAYSGFMTILFIAIGWKRHGCSFGLAFSALLLSAIVLGIGLVLRGMLWPPVACALMAFTAAGSFASLAAKFQEPVLWVFGVVMAVWGALMLGVARWHSSVNRAIGSDTCRDCGYALRGTPSERCPECGEPTSSRMRVAQ